MFTDQVYDALNFSSMNRAFGFWTPTLFFSLISNQDIHGRRGQRRDDASSAGPRKLVHGPQGGQPVQPPQMEEALLCSPGLRDEGGNSKGLGRPRPQAHLQRQHISGETVFCSDFSPANPPWRRLDG